MMSKPLAIGALIIGCLAAAAAGGYLAGRPSTSLGAGVSADPAAVSQPASTSPSAAPVRESEGLVEPAKGDPTKPADSSQPVEAKPPVTAPPTAVVGARPSQTRAAATSVRDTRRPATVARNGEPAAAPASSADQSWKGLEKPWPSGSASDASTSAATNAAPDTTPAVAATPVAPPPPPVKEFEELVVPPDSVIGIQLDTPLTSDRARLEDPVESRVTRDVRVGDRVAIPAGSQVLGSVTQVERGGKFKERARLGIRFHTLVLADGTRIPLRTDAIFRDGAAPGKESAAKIGGAAVGGAILGAIFGGGKGAATGGAIGAAGGAAAVASGDRNPVTLAAGTNLTFRILSPVAIEVEKDEKL